MNIYWVGVSLVLAVALGRGGRPEQLAAAVLVCASGLSLAAAPDPSRSFREIEWSLFAVDALSFASFTVLALRANRRWPACIAGLKLLPLFGHVAKIADPGSVSVFTYAWLGEAWTYLYMIVILTGVVRHQFRLARHGSDAGWRPAG